jgi:cold shock protein
MVTAMRLHGTVKWFSDDRGFGFINCADGRSIFFHAVELRKSGIIDIAEGRKLSFDTEPSDKGPRAVDIQVED